MIFLLLLGKKQCFGIDEAHFKKSLGASRLRQSPEEPHTTRHFWKSSSAFRLRDKLKPHFGVK
jgi:hypothetical protein